MASTVDTYGTFSANKVEVDSIIKFTGSTDDSKSISIQLAGNPSAAGDVVYTLPVITSGKTLATTDDVAGLPSSTNNQVLVSNSGTYASVSVSGDLTNAAGAFTVANNAISSAKIANDAVSAQKIADNAVTTAKINADAVTGAKIADQAVDSEHYTHGSIDTVHIADAQITVAKLEAVSDGQILVGNGSNRPVAVAVSGDITLANNGAVAIASGVIVNADVNASAAIAGSKVAPDFGSQTVTTTGDITTSGDLQVAANKTLRFGADANGVWRIAIAGGGGSLLIQKKESGSWVTKSSIAA
jgi:hypothetical protein